MTSTAKPKPKFSSRNLSAVFKAPLRTKPLPDNATGPLPRNNGRLLVLGRTTAAPPAPVNTTSLRKENLAADVHVSLVPTCSNWATNAAVLTEKPAEEQKADKSECNDHAADVDIAEPAPDQAWTPESVAEHLHTSAVAATAVAAQSSGRWGDDEVEHEIVQSAIRCQRQKEREFPDLKEAAEEAQLHHGHAPAGERPSPSIGPQQQHPGRATGRWAHFNEHEEMRRRMHDDRWSHDRYPKDNNDRWARDRCPRDDDRWSRDRYARGENDYWSSNRYGRDGDERWPCSPQNDGGNERAPRLCSFGHNRTVSPIPNDNHTHFSSSDVRFDMITAGDHVLSHTSHRMDWSRSPKLRHDARSSSPVSSCGPEVLDSVLSPRRLLSPPSASPAAAEPGWRNVSPIGHRFGWAQEPASPTSLAWFKTEQKVPSAPVAPAAASNREPLSSSSANSGPSPEQQVQLLKRPKLLFDPKTGGMINAEEITPPVKRSASDRQDKPASGRTRAQARASIGAENASDTRVENAKLEETMDNSGHAGEDTTMFKETSSRRNEAVTSKQGNADENSTWNGAQPDTHPRQKRRQNPMGKKSVKGSSAKAKNTTTKRDFLRTMETTSNTGRDKRAYRERKREDEHAKDAQDRPASESQANCERGVHQPKLATTEVARLNARAGGAAAGVVVVDGEQEGSEGVAFEAARSRRAVLSEKKHLQQRLKSEEVAQPQKQQAAKGKWRPRCNEQSKGEGAQENVDSSHFPTKTVAPNAAANANVIASTTDLIGRAGHGPMKKPRSVAKSVLKPTIENVVPESHTAYASFDGDTAVRKARVRKQKAPKVREDRAGDTGKKTGGAVDKMDKLLGSNSTTSPTKPTEQVAGEPAVESPMSKKRPQSSKSTVSPADTKRKAWVERRSGVERRKQATPKRFNRTVERTGVGDAAVATTKETATPAASTKTRPKQVKQVYMVKTPAPPAAGARSTSTAA